VPCLPRPGRAAGLHVNGVKQIDSFLRTDEQRIRDLFYDRARADEMMAQWLTPEHADVAMKNRATTAKLPGSRAAMIHTSANGCIGSMCRRSWSGVPRTSLL